MGSYFTQAGNFADNDSGNVDTRRGLYSISVPVATLVGNGLMGPQLPMHLGYSPLSTADVGFGQGWNISMTTFDHSGKQLQAASGESLALSEPASGSSMIIGQQKLKSLKVDRLGDAVYKVTHCNGVVEMLKGKTVAGNLKVPNAIFAPNGFQLSLDWDFDESSESWWLAGVSDNDGPLLQVTHSGASATLTFWPNSDAMFVLELLMDDQRRLTSITRGSMKWTMEYLDFTMPDGSTAPLLNKTTYPTGLREAVEYQNTQKFPDFTRMPPQPCVSQYTQWPGAGQPALVTTYEFSDENYLGFGGHFIEDDWDPSSDNLYNQTLNDYTYSCTITMGTGADEVITERRFDTYHLLVSERVTRANTTRVEKAVEYGATYGVAFDDQPANFQMPRKTTTTYAYLSPPVGEPAHRIETELTEYDDNGNKTRHETPDGVVHTWDYYPPEGDTNCPGDPNKLCSRLKSNSVTFPAVTVTPLGTKPGGFGGPGPSLRPYDTPVYTKTLEYTSLKVGGDLTDPANPIPYTVMALNASHFANGRQVYGNDYSYLTVPEHLGRLGVHTETVYGPDGTPYPTTHTFEYTSDDNTVGCSRTLLTHDQLTIKTSDTHCKRRGLVKGNANSAGVKTEYTYDNFNRMLTATSAPGGDYEQVTTWTHDLISGEGDDEPATLAYGMNNNTGGLARNCYDGFGQVVRREAMVAGDWLTESEFTYDPYGKVVERVHYDLIDPDKPEAGSVEHHTTMAYDEWGNIRTVTDSTGRVEHTYMNLVTLQKKTVLEPATDAYTLTQLNYRGVDVAHSTFDGSALRTITQDYDGAKRLRRRTDELGISTYYDYDEWIRVKRITLGDRTVVEKTYAPHSSSPLLTEITVNKQSRGTQTFDGLGRLLSTTTGARTYNYAYDGGATEPHSITQPDGTSVTQTLIPELGDAVESIQAGTDDDQIEHRFEYAPKSGLLARATQASAHGPTVAYSHDGVDRITQTTVTHDAQTVRTTTNKYSAFGRLTSRDGPLGVSRKVNYDPYGRIDTVSNGTSTVQMKYDDYGVLKGWDVKNPSGVTHSMSMTFDKLGRETNRRLQDHGKNWSMSLTRGFQQDGLVNNRQVAYTGPDGTYYQRFDIYKYDDRKRLIEYHCSGKSQPIDATGLGVVYQRFDYDEINNLTYVYTKYIDGSVNEATFLFEYPDPCQVSHVTNTHPLLVSGDLTYDDFGRLIRDEYGRTLTYDSLGRLTQVSDDAPITRYRYDALAIRRAQEFCGDGHVDEYYYDGAAVGCVITRRDGDDTTQHWLRAQGHAVVSQRNNDAPIIYGTDEKKSVTALATADGSPPEALAYTPFGQRAAPVSAECAVGFNGEVYDAAAGYYHLGNGYRPYSPTLMRFIAPDSLSPFGSGGINPYCYCDGDPINHADPTGHLSTWQWIGIGIIVVAFIVMAPALLLLSSVVAGLLTGAAVGASLIGVGLATVSVIAGVAAAGTAMGYEINESKAQQLTKGSLDGSNQQSSAYQARANVFRGLMVTMLGLELATAGPIFLGQLSEGAAAAADGGALGGDAEDGLELRLSSPDRGRLPAPREMVRNVGRSAPNGELDHPEAAMRPRTTSETLNRTATSRAARGMRTRSTTESDLSDAHTQSALTRATRQVGAHTEAPSAPPESPEPPSYESLYPQRPAPSNDALASSVPTRPMSSQTGSTAPLTAYRRMGGQYQIFREDDYFHSRLL